MKTIEERLSSVLNSIRLASNPKRSVIVRQELKSELDEFTRKAAIHFSHLMKKYKVDGPTQLILVEYMLKKIKRHL